MESKLQSRIIADLRRKGWIVVKVVRCNLSGWPDLTAYKNKVAIFMEIKDEGKKTEPLQDYRHEELRKQGFEVYVINNWEDYEKLNL